ncbi:MAG: hypothetical protein KDJ90_20660 [Nitratireductor sp.]|nr:hypothetical protein [Nitratireductor sp.]
MIAKTFLAALGVMAASTLAHADAIPSFLSDGQKYVTDIKACTAEVVEETDILQLTKDGVFGYEYGCNFVQFMDVRDVGDGKVYQYLAISACGDDSGVTRPDMFTMMPSDEGRLYITSQNEYLTQLALERSSTSTEGHWIVEKEFVRCPN